MNKKILVTLAVVSLSVGAILVFRAFRPDPDLLLKQRNSERALGSEKAPVWVTEYFDYQCPPCAMASEALKKAMETHSGQIYLQARFFPLPVHKNAMKAALFAECASHQKGKFWALHEEIFKHQNEWATDNYAGFRFTSYAESVGLDLQKLEACVQDPGTEKTVLDEKKKAEEIGVVMTPTFYVNGKIAVGVKAMMAALDEAFKEKAV